MSSNRQTDSLEGKYPPPDYPESDISSSNEYIELERSENNNHFQTGSQRTNSSQGSSGYCHAGPIHFERIQENPQRMNSSQGSSGYSHAGPIHFERIQENPQRTNSSQESSGYLHAGPIHFERIQENPQGIGESIYDNNVNDRRNRIPIRTTRFPGASRRGNSTHSNSTHIYSEIDNYTHSNIYSTSTHNFREANSSILTNTDTYKSQGFCDKKGRLFNIFITIVVIAGLALLLTFLANDQSRMDDLNKNVQTQTSSLKGKDDSLETLTEYQRQELEKTSVIINITDLSLVANSNLTANILSLANKTKHSLKEIGELIGVMSRRTNSSINDIENMVEASFSQLQTSSEDIANTMRALSNHTKTSNSHVKELIKEQSNQTKTHLENMMKELFREFEENLIAVIESRIGGVNNSLNVTTGECVDSCWGVANGDYQSCVTCHGYVSCSNNFIYHRTCPTILIWDDSRKQCEKQSKTCNAAQLRLQKGGGA